MFQPERIPAKITRLSRVIWKHLFWLPSVAIFILLVLDAFLRLSKGEDVQALFDFFEKMTIISATLSVLCVEVYTLIQNKKQSISNILKKSALWLFGSTILFMVTFLLQLLNQPEYMLHQIILDSQFSFVVNIINLVIIVLLMYGTWFFTGSILELSFILGPLYEVEEKNKESDQMQGRKENIEMNCLILQALRNIKETGSNKINSEEVKENIGLTKKQLLAVMQARGLIVKKDINRNKDSYVITDYGRELLNPPNFFKRYGWFVAWATLSIYIGVEVIKPLLISGISTLS